MGLDVGHSFPWKAPEIRRQRPTPHYAHCLVQFPTYALERIQKIESLVPSGNLRDEIQAAWQLQQPSEFC